jgi:hypothetical protein
MYVTVTFLHSVSSPVARPLIVSPSIPVSLPVSVMPGFPVPVPVSMSGFPLIGTWTITYSVQQTWCTGSRFEGNIHLFRLCRNIGCLLRTRWRAFHIIVAAVHARRKKVSGIIFIFLLSSQLHFFFGLAAFANISGYPCAPALEHWVILFPVLFCSLICMHFHIGKWTCSCIVFAEGRIFLGYVVAMLGDITILVTLLDDKKNRNGTHLHLPSDPTLHSYNTKYLERCILHHHCQDRTSSFLDGN